MSVNLSGWWQLLRQSAPYWLTNIFSMLYFYFDTLMLAFLAGTAVTGWYNASFKLIAALSFIPVTIMYSIFPTMSRLYAMDRKSLSGLLETVLRYITLLILPVMAGTVIFAGRLIQLFYGEGFSMSVPVLQVLIVSEVFLFYNTVWLMLYNSMGKQAMVARIIGICLLINIVLNLLFIPFLYHTGAAIATLLCEITVSLSFLWQNKKMGIILPSWKLFAKPLAASVIMSAGCYFLAGLHMVAIIAAAAIIYSIALLLLGGISVKEVMGMLGSLRK
jgi:O-antigen/teichoic acid export membrane protein